MKKSLLLAASLLLPAFTMPVMADDQTASGDLTPPEGNYYLMGLNGETTQGESNLLIEGERDEDDIDEGYWRWSIPSIEVTETTGTITIAGPDGLVLGFSPINEESGIANNLNNSMLMMEVAPGGDPINYDLKEGTYNLLLSYWSAEGYTDEDGEPVQPSWYLILRPLKVEGEDDESLYLLGFNGVEEQSAAVRFVKEEEDLGDGEIMISYVLHKYKIESCEAGFTVLDAGNDIVYGLDKDLGVTMPEITNESNMTFLGVDGEPVVCKLEPAFYDIAFTPVGTSNLILFTKSADQTEYNALEYYLIGLDGVTEMTAANKFERVEETEEYEDEDTGEISTYTSVSYTLVAKVTDACELTVVSADGKIVYGYNSDMSMFLPNDLSDEMSFSALVCNGEALNCTLSAGEYTFTFSPTDNTASFMAEPYEDDSVVEEIGIEDVAPVYYDLQGRRVMNPAKGIFIEKRGSKVSKVIR